MPPGRRSGSSRSVTKRIAEMARSPDSDVNKENSPTHLVSRSKKTEITKLIDKKTVLITGNRTRKSTSPNYKEPTLRDYFKAHKDLQRLRTAHVLTSPAALIDVSVIQGGAQQPRRIGMPFILLSYPKLLY